MTNDEKDAAWLRFYHETLEDVPVSADRVEGNPAGETFEAAVFNVVRVSHGDLHAPAVRLRVPSDLLVTPSGAMEIARTLAQAAETAGACQAALFRLRRRAS